MILADVHDLLALAASFDNRKFDDATVAAWHAVLHDLEAGDAQTAVLQHFSASREYLMPVHIREVALALKRRRDYLAREAKEAERLAIEAAARGPVEDRSEDVQELLQQARTMLPEGNPDQLRHMSGHWRQVRRRRERAEAAVPNPHFRGWHVPPGTGVDEVPDA